MKEKYLITVAKVTKEGLNETHDIKLYDSFYGDEELLYFLQDDLEEVLNKNFSEGDFVELMLFEVFDREVKMRKGFKGLVKSDSVDDYFSESLILEEDSQDLSLFRALLKEVRIRKRKKHYMVVLLKDTFKSDGEILRTVVSKQKFDDEKKLFDFLKGPVNTVLTGGRINSLILNRKELTCAYLYEWTEDSCGSCYEYSEYLKHGKKSKPSDFFRIKQDKDKDFTLMFLLG